MALEREGVELVIENLSGYLLGLTNAADAAENVSRGLYRMGPAGVVASSGLNIAVDAAERLNNITSQLVTSLERIALAAGAAFGAAGAIGVRGAADIQRSLTIVQGITGATADQMDALQRKTLEVSSTFGVSANEIAQAAQLYVKAGGSIEGAMDGALASVAQLKVIAPQLGTEEATNAIITLANNFKLSSQQAADAIVQLSKTSTLNFTEIVQALRQIGPEAANLGVPINDIVAALSLLTQRGLTGTQAGTQLRQMFIDLTRPSKDAADELNRVNLSLFDQAGAIRPLPDIFADIVRAYGTTASSAQQATDFERAYGLAVDFKSRAQIAANIIAADGVEKFRQLKEEQGDISALQLVSLVTQTTGFQFDRLKTSLENVAITIAGPVNVAFGRLLTQLNNTIQLAANTGVFKTLGDAIVAIAAGEGFGRLEQEIHDLTDNPQLIAFINGVLASLLAVRDGIVSNVIPAFEGLGSAISTAVGNTNFTDFFSRIASVAEAASQAIAGIIERITSFVSKVAEGGPTADRVTKILEGLATLLLGQVFVGFATASVGAAIFINLMEKLGEVAQSPIIAVANLATALSNFANFAIGFADIVSNSFKSTFAVVAPTVELIAAQALIASGQTEAGLNTLHDAFTRFQDVPEAFSQLGKAVQAADVPLESEQNTVAGLATRLEQLKQQFTELNKTTLNNAQEQEQFRRQYESLAADIRNTSTELEKHQAILSRMGVGPGGQNTNALRDLQQQAAQAAQSLVKLQEAWDQGMDVQPLFDKAQADLDGLVTFASQSAQRLRDALNQTNQPTTTAGPIVDPKAVQAQANEVAKLSEQLASREVELEQQAKDRVVDIDRNAADRQQEILSSYENRRTEIEQQAQDQIDKQQRDHDQQVAERAQDRTLQRTLQENQVSWQNYFRAIDLMQNQSDAVADRSRQQQRQDIERTFNQSEQLAERDYNNQIARSDRLFQRTQQTQSTAFSRQQQDAEKQFQEQIDAETRRHDLAEQLARATTPQERQQIQQRATQSESDRKFQEGEQEKLLNFRRQQENQATTFRNQQEDASFNRRESQQLAEYSFRIQLELQRVAFTRRLDDEEFNYRQGLALRNFNRETDQQAQQRTLQQQGQDQQNAYQDAREQQRFEQRQNDTNEQAALQVQKLGIQTNQQLSNLEDQRARQALQQDESVGREQQRLRETLLQQIDSAERAHGTSPALEALRQQIALQTQPAIDRMLQAEQQLNQTLTPGLRVAVPELPGIQQVPFNFTPTLPQPPSLPSNILNQSVQGFGQLLLSPQYSTSMARGVANGLRDWQKDGQALPVVIKTPIVTAPSTVPASTSAPFDILGHAIRDFRG